VFSFLLNIILVFSVNDNVENQLQRYLEAQITGYEKISFEFVSDWSKYQDLEILTNEDVNLNGNIAQIPVNYIRGNENRKIRLSIKVKAYKNILVSKENIKRGTLLDNNNFDVRLVDCITLTDPISSIDALNNFRAASYIKIDEVLLSNSIEPIPDIESGDKIVAHSIAGNVDIQISAVARQEGSVDEIIRVRTSDNKLYRAKVLDNSNVLIIE
jgi:flagella basal body P-ring formation protein FlgA